VRYGILGEHIPGGLASLVAVRADNVLPLPSHVSTRTPPPRPHQHDGLAMLVTQAGPAPARTCSSSASARRISTAVQIAKLCGARVIVTFVQRSEARARPGRSARRRHQLQDDTRSGQGRCSTPPTSGRRDVVIENVGAATWKDSIRSLKGGGRLVTCGATSGPVGETLIPARVLKRCTSSAPRWLAGKEFNDVMRLFFRDAQGDHRRGRSPQGRAAAQARLAEASSSARSCSPRRGATYGDSR